MIVRIYFCLFQEETRIDVIHDSDTFRSAAFVDIRLNGRQRMDPVALLRQTLRYWRKIYKTYHEEVALGYCWADYLFEISDELSTNLSVSLPVATGDRNTTIGATKSQQNPFPQNAMVDATMPLRETQQKGKHLREKRSHTTAGFAIARFTNDSDEQRIVSRVKLNQ